MEKIKTGFVYILETKKGLVIGESTSDSYKLKKVKAKLRRYITNEWISGNTSHYRNRLKSLLRYLKVSKITEPIKIDFEEAVKFAEYSFKEKSKKPDVKIEVKAKKTIKPKVHILFGSRCITCEDLAKYFEVRESFINEKINGIIKGNEEEAFIKKNFITKNEKLFITYEGLQLFNLINRKDFIYKKIKLLQYIKYKSKED